MAPSASCAAGAAAGTRSCHRSLELSPVAGAAILRRLIISLECNGNSALSYVENDVISTQKCTNRACFTHRIQHKRYGTI